MKTKRLNELKEIIKRYLNYHNGVARCDSAEEIQECNCAVCSDARKALGK
jgi:hypothetical protein